jgi:hypothetical protein
MTFRNKLIFYGEELFVQRPTLKLQEHPLSPAATAFLIHSQLPSTSGGRLLHPQPEDAPCSADRGPIIIMMMMMMMMMIIIIIIN